LTAFSCRFDKKQRLQNAREFDYVFERARRSSNRCFTVLARANTNTASTPRLGLIISKRCAKSAVRRNRLKRLIRESFRRNKEDLKGLDIVVLGKAAAVSKTNQELLTLLNRHWKDLIKCKN